MKKIATSLVLMATTLMASCGGGETSSEEPKLQLQSENSPKEETTVAVQDEAPAEEEAPAMDAAESVSLVIEGNDQMRFNKPEMTVIAGQEVTLTLKHVGKLPIESMGHNWVLLAPDTDIPTFGQAAATAGLENDHIPGDMKDQVLAYTKLIGGGEEATVTFTAPEAGEYQYICSFPGHYALMKGKLIVK